MSEPSITASTTFKRNETDFLFTEIDNETVLMNINTSGYLGLNKVGTDLWMMLADEMSFEALIANLLEKYEVDKTTCEAEVTIILKQMVNNEILHLATI